MVKQVRLDAELARRKLLPSREAARRAIEEGRVSVNGIPATRAATLVAKDAPIALTEGGARFVSRGGDKLDGALARLDVPVAGRRWLDAGASTGGFTDRLLQGGAAAVIAVDVGYGQLAWSLREDERVVTLERTNVRTIKPEELPFRPEGVTADLSFISLALVLPALTQVAEPDADFVLLVKPQFEVGRELVGKGGVVRDSAHWKLAVVRVIGAAEELGLGLAGAAASAIAGPKGNREFFVHLRRGADAGAEAIEQAMKEAQ